MEGRFTAHEGAASAVREELRRRRRALVEKMDDELRGILATIREQPMGKAVEQVGADYSFVRKILGIQAEALPKAIRDEIRKTVVTPLIERFEIYEELQIAMMEAVADLAADDDLLDPTEADDGLEEEAGGDR